MSNNLNVVGDLNDYFYNEHQRKILEAIKLHKHQPIEIEHHTRISKPTILKHIGILEQNGFIEYEQKFNEEKGRAAGAYITLKGEKEYERLTIENQRTHLTKDNIVNSIPLYQPDNKNFISGTSIFETPKLLTEKEQLEIERKIQSFAQNLQKDYPNIQTGDIHLIFFPKVKK